MNIQKSLNAVLMLVAVIVFLISGISFASQKGKEDNKTTSADVKREAEEAIDAIGNYSVEQRDMAIKKVKILTEKLDARIDKMQSRIEEKWDKMDKASREEARKTLTVLRKKRNELSEWYGGLKHSSSSAWDHVKKGFAESYEALSNAFDKAESEFSSGRSD